MDGSYAKSMSSSILMNVNIFGKIMFRKLDKQIICRENY